MFLSEWRKKLTKNKKGPIVYCLKILRQELRTLHSMHFISKMQRLSWSEHICSLSLQRVSTEAEENPKVKKVDRRSEGIFTLNLRLL